MAEQAPGQAKLTAKLGPYLDKGTFGIAAKDMQSNREYRLADDRVFDGGSTLKLAILAYLFNQASNNQFDLNETVTIQRADVQNYGTGSLRYQNMPQTLSYRQLVLLITKQSDNTAAHVLGQRLNEERVQEFVNRIGLTNTSMVNHSTTARDMLLLVEKLYRGELADPALTKELLEQMRGTDFEDRLPAKLPAGTIVSHKTGDAIDGGYHDVGIVERDGKVYAAAIFSHAVPFPLLPDISREVFDYMTQG